MTKAKISVTIPKNLMTFLDFYSVVHKTHNRSHIIQKALELLQQNELEVCYIQANSEINHEFEICNEDGISD
jgi:antitoxin ParD1/3/4